MGSDASSRVKRWSTNSPARLQLAMYSGSGGEECVVDWLSMVKLLIPFLVAAGHAEKGFLERRLLRIDRVG